MTGHRTLFRTLSLLAVLTLIVGACSTPAASPSVSQQPTASGPTGGGYEEFVPDPTLLASAKTEGTVTTIALPHDWCNYGESISVFKERTGLAVNELDPLAGSGDEVEAVRANKDNLIAKVLPPTSDVEPDSLIVLWDIVLDKG